MSVSKIKNIIIAVLVLANLVFLSVVLADTVSDRRETREMLKNMAELYRSAGVALSDDAFCTGRGACAVPIARSAESEAAIASVLIGDASSVHRGSVSTYRGGGGEAVFRSGGEFSADILGDAIHFDKNAEKTVEKLVEAMELEAAVSCGNTTAENETHITAVCLYEGCEIFNCTLDFCFHANGALGAVSGRLPAPAGEGAVPDGETVSASALMSFFALISSENVSCTRIDSVSFGYIMSMTPLGSGALTPVYRIATDNGEYFMSAEDNALIDEKI